MRKKLFQNKITVRQSSIHGYGVFADESIKKGAIIEQCHVILTKGEDEDFMDYYFAAGPRRNAILLGYGCIYNHSNHPNAEVVFDHDYSGVTIKAIAPIKKGQEIRVSYGKQWFQGRDFKRKEVG